MDAASAASAALQLSVLPSAVMLVMSLLAFAIKVPARVIAALQHLAAGIVLSAVAIELVPAVMAADRDGLTTLSMSCGFALGIAMFLALGELCKGGEDAIEPDPIETEAPLNPALAALQQAHLSRRHSRRRTSSGKLSVMRLAQEAVTRRHLAPLRFPLGLFVAVSTDALVDGLLIGISSASGSSAGKVMAVALSIEMGFLGLTFATTLTSLRQPLLRACVAVLVPALLIAGGGCAGGALSASLLATSPILHVGLLAFGVAALLYLVTEELLLEAHAGGEEHVWWVDLQFFLGFFLSMMWARLTE